MTAAVTAALSLQLAVSAILFLIYSFLYIFVGPLANRKALHALLAGASISVVIMSSWLLWYPGKWDTRKDHVLVQWEFWLGYGVAAMLTGFASGLYLSVRPFWTIVMGVLAGASAAFVLLATVSGRTGNYLEFFVAVALWGLLVATNIAMRRRESDQWYWFVWVMCAVGSAVFGVTWFFGHASLHSIDYNTEVWIYAVACLVFLNLFGVVLALTYNGGGLISDVRRRFSRGGSKKIASDIEDNQGRAHRARSSAASAAASASKLTQRKTRKD